MTDGEKLKQTLGLQDYSTVYIARLILPHSQKIDIVFYDSMRKNGLSKRRCQLPPFVAMAFSGKDLKYGKYEVPTMTPLMSIEQWNGDLNQYIIIPVNLAYSFNISSKDFSRLPESIQSLVLEDIKPIYIGKIALKELTIYDLKDKSNISDLTVMWWKDRNRVQGNAAKTTKLLDCIVDESDKSITFQFLTEATELNGKKPNDSIESSYKFYKGDKGEVKPNNSFKIVKDRSKTYELQIKILDFFDWLDTYNGNEITAKDIKDILQISDVQVFSNSPAFHWQGANFNLSQLDSSIYPTYIPNDTWGNRHGDPSGYFLDKHLFSLLQSIEFFFNLMASMLTKKLKDRSLI